MTLATRVSSPGTGCSAAVATRSSGCWKSAAAGPGRSAAACVACPRPWGKHRNCIERRRNVAKSRALWQRRRVRGASIIIVGLLIAAAARAQPASPALSPAAELEAATVELQQRPGDPDAAWRRARALRALELPLNCRPTRLALAARGVRSDEAKKIAAELRTAVVEAERGAWRPKRPGAR